MLKFYLKQFCCFMGFVEYDHPWMIDYRAMCALKFMREKERRKKANEEVFKRFKELESKND